MYFSLKDGPEKCAAFHEEDVKKRVVELGYITEKELKRRYALSGIGLQAWKTIEKMYPDVKIWETVTHFFQKRNIYFYVNKCGFHIVEYHNKWNPIMENGVPVDDEMFVFRKKVL